MATHSNILAWKIPWTEERGGLQSEVTKSWTQLSPGNIKNLDKYSGTASINGRDSVVGSHSLLQGILLTQESNSGLLQCRQILYHLSHQGSPPSPSSDTAV